MDWKKSGDYASVQEIILKKSGQTLEQICEPQTVPAAEITNLPAAADIIASAAKKGGSAAIVGDYDADGITASAILSALFRKIGFGSVESLIPKRITDGYGFSPAMLDRISSDFIVTVDNGITAFDAVSEAKRRGKTVVILDHHLPDAVRGVPCADIVVDPHVRPGASPFDYYCGAGLAYKLSRLMLPEDEKFERFAAVLACIGTVADCMPVISDNRRIVIDGLGIINGCAGELPPGLRAVVKTGTGDSYCDSETIGFKIAPLINAPGRMYDAGGTSSLKALLCRDETDSAVYAAKMAKINEDRKTAVSGWTGYIKKSLRASGCAVKAPLIVKAKKIPEGIVGIITGKLADEYRVPAFVFTESREPGILKGSGRSYGGFNLKKLVDSAADLLVKSGGHEGAAGLSVTEENFGAMSQRMNEYTDAAGFEAEDALRYDMDIGSGDIPGVLAELKAFEPFGETVEKPIFRIERFEAETGRDGSHFRTMGADASHVKIYGGRGDAVAFGLAEKYAALGCPKTLSVIGTVDENRFNGSAVPQFTVLDMRPVGN